MASYSTYTSTSGFSNGSKNTTVTSAYSMSKAYTDACAYELNDWVATRGWAKPLKLKYVFYKDTFGIIRCDWDVIKHVSDDKYKLIDRIAPILSKHKVNIITIGDDTYIYDSTISTWILEPKNIIPNNIFIGIGGGKTTMNNGSSTTTNKSIFKQDSIVLTALDKTEYELQVLSDGTLLVRNNHSKAIISEISPNKVTVKEKLTIKSKLKSWLQKQIEKI